MPKIDSEKFYTSAIQLHGESAKGLNWTSQETQELRFDAILDLLDDDLSDATLCDAGCGFGDFYFYTLKKGKKIEEYIGIDSHIDMYSIASNKTGCEILNLDITREKIPHAKHYICSGALNILHTFEIHLFIRNCFLACENSFIFNALHGDIESKTYNYLTISKIKEIAKELNVREVQYRTGYLKDDITVGFFK